MDSKDDLPPDEVIDEKTTGETLCICSTFCLLLL